MENQLSEEQVLEILDIPDFRHITKDKVVSLASLFPQMDAVTVQKAIEQFPDFSKTIVELATDLKGAMDTGMKHNSDSMKQCSEMLQTIIDVCKQQVNKDDIPFEQKKYYMDKMFEASQLMMEKDTENKEFIKQVFGIAGMALVIFGGTLVTALGGKFDIKLPWKK